MNGSFLRFYVHEGHRHHHHLLWEWLMQQANKLGIRGGSAFQGHGGIRTASHTARGYLF